METGSRYSTHYNRMAVISTPPEAFLAEGQAVLWYRSAVAVYANYARSYAFGPAQMIGGGFKLPFLSFYSSSASVVSGIRLMVLMDLESYEFAQDPTTVSYPVSGLILRYGGAINWYFGKTGIYLDTTMMVTTINENFFIAPLVGIGLHF